MNRRERINQGQIIDLAALRPTRTHPALYMLQAMVKGLLISQPKPKPKPNKDLGGPSSKVPKPPTGAGLT